jgi:hypothetical protein
LEINALYARRHRVLQFMRGNATTGRHDADAAILFEAGC